VGPSGVAGLRDRGGRRFLLFVLGDSVAVGLYGGVSRRRGVGVGAERAFCWASRRRRLDKAGIRASAAEGHAHRGRGLHRVDRCTVVRLFSPSPRGAAEGDGCSDRPSASAAYGVLSPSHGIGYMGWAACMDAMAMIILTVTIIFHACHQRSASTRSGSASSSS